MDVRDMAVGSASVPSTKIVLCSSKRKFYQNSYLSLIETLISFFYILDDWYNDYYQPNDPFAHQSEIYGVNVINKNILDSFTPKIMKKNVRSQDSGPFLCIICSKKYKYRRDLIRHEKSECINCPKRFPCSQCDKAYFRLGHLQDHMKKRHNAQI